MEKSGKKWKKVEKSLWEIRKAIEPDNHLFHILLQHMGIQGEMPGVPGVRYQDVLPLRDRIDDLALGHFHLGFQIRDFIFNPGSPETVSASEQAFQRGVYFVEVAQKNGIFPIKVELIQLQNRFVQRKTIFLPQEFHSHYEVSQFVQAKLLQQIENTIPLDGPVNRKSPLLYITLKGKKVP